MHKMMKLNQFFLTFLIVIFFSISSNAKTLKFIEADTEGIPISECKKVFEKGKKINFKDHVNSSSSISWYMYKWKVYGFIISNSYFGCDLRGHYE